MYNFCKKLFFFVPIITSVLSAQMPTHYDFFKESSIRIHEASGQVKKAFGSPDGSFYAVQNAAQYGSLQELAALYTKLVSSVQTKLQKEVSCEAEAAYVVLFLEKMRDCYYTHLDCIEASLPYWEWAKHHPHRYTASQLPHNWFRHEANQVEVDHIYTMIIGLREICSKEFGIIVRLLGIWHEGHADVATWLAEVRTTMISMIPGAHITLLQTTESLIQVLSTHEADIAKMVASVQKPQSLKRNWIPALTVSVLVGAATYYYINNQQMINEFCFDGFEKLRVSFVENFYTPVKSFINSIRNGQEERYTNNPIVVNGESQTREYWEKESEKYFGEAEKRMDQGILELSKLPTKGVVSEKPNDSIQKEGIKLQVSVLELKIPSQDVADVQNRLQEMLENVAEPKLQSVSAAVQALCEAFKNMSKSAFIKGQIIEHDEKQAMTAFKTIMNDTAFNRKLFGLIPAYLLVTKTYDGVKGAYNWITKRDRSTLIRRLRQAQRVVVRTEHTRELSDAEYGQMLYLLSKAYDQVAANVLSDERIEFLNDLTYIADAQSSTQQKRETLKIMFDRFRSLEKPA